MPLLELHFNPFRSLTLRGVVMVLAGVALGAFDTSAIGGDLGPIVIIAIEYALKLLGGVIAALGVRNAIAKNGSGV